MPKDHHHLGSFCFSSACRTGTHSPLSAHIYRVVLQRLRMETQYLFAAVDRYLVCGSPRIRAQH